MQLSEFEVELVFINDDGSEQPLEEYGVTVEDYVRSTAFVCSRSNARFGIRLKRNSHERDVNIKVHLDGLPPDRRWSWRKTKTESLVDRLGVQKDATMPLVFQNVEIRESGEGIAYADCVQLGTVQVDLYHVAFTGERPRTFFGRKPTLTAAVNDEDLRARKKEHSVPLSHRIGLGRKENRTLSTTVKVYKTIAKDPIAIFKFQYASRDVLEAWNIIPKSIRDRDSDIVKVDEEDDLRAALDEMKRKYARLEKKTLEYRKRMPDEGTNGTETIDLTEDGEGGAPQPDKDADGSSIVGSAASHALDVDREGKKKRRRTRKRKRSANRS